MLPSYTWSTGLRAGSKPPQDRQRGADPQFSSHARFCMINRFNHSSFQHPARAVLGQEQETPAKGSGWPKRRLRRGGGRKRRSGNSRQKSKNSENKHGAQPFPAKRGCVLLPILFCLFRWLRGAAETGTAGGSARRERSRTGPSHPLPLPQPAALWGWRSCPDPRKSTPSAKAWAGIRAICGLMAPMGALGPHPLRKLQPGTHAGTNARKAAELHGSLPG